MAGRAARRALGSVRVHRAGDAGPPLETISGSVSSRVFRDLGTGRLAFVYQVSGQSDSIVDLERVTLGSFASFTTDVFSSGHDFGVERSADGATLNFGFSTGSPHTMFLVRSNANTFDADGTFFVEMDFEPSGVAVRGTFASFQPVAGDGGGPNPIPLPPGAWTALATAGALGAAGRARALLRRHR